MNTFKANARAISPLLVLLVSVSANAVEKYAVTEIKPAGAAICQVSGLNSSGQVVGAFFMDAAYQVGRGFVTGPNGVGMRVVDTLGGDQSGVTSINDEGLAVGYATTVNNISQDSIEIPNGTTSPMDLGGMGGTISGVNSINSKGRMVGSGLFAGGGYGGYVTVSGKNLAKIYFPVQTVPMHIGDDGTVVGTFVSSTGSNPFITGANAKGMTLLGTLGGDWASANSMNRWKEVVGSSLLPDGTTTHAFITSPGGGNPRDIGILGVMAFGASINDTGLVVGGYFTTWADPERAFIAHRSGWSADLNTLVKLEPGRYFSLATAINNAGQIAAISNDRRCYLLTPTSH